MSKVLLSVLIKGTISSDDAKDLVSQVICITSSYAIEDLAFYFEYDDSYDKYCSLINNVFRKVTCERFGDFSKHTRVKLDLQKDISTYFSTVKSSALAAQSNGCDDVIIYSYSSGSSSLLDFDFSLPTNYIHMRYVEGCDVGYNTEIVYCNTDTLIKLSDFEGNIEDYQLLVERNNKVPWNNFYHKPILNRFAIKSLLILKKMLEGHESDQTISAKVLRRVENKLDYLHVSGETSLAPSVCIDKIYPVMNLEYFVKYHIYTQGLKYALRLYKESDFMNLRQHTLSLNDEDSITVYPVNMMNREDVSYDALQNYLGYSVFSNNVAEKLPLLARDFILYMFMNRMDAFGADDTDGYFSFLCSCYEIEETGHFYFISNES